MSSGSEGSPNVPYTESLEWLGINVAVAFAVGIIYALVTYPFIFALGLGGALRWHHLALWVAGYGGIGFVVAVLIVEHRILYRTKATMVFWAILTLLLSLLLLGLAHS